SLFFNVPPPTSLSTLSLHDALPIFRFRGDRRDHRVARSCRLVRFGRIEEIEEHLVGDQRGPARGAELPQPRPPAPTQRRAGRVVDRKSTRLNSSHVAISYAVFCLKK